jgi:hypothetical protein
VTIAGPPEVSREIAAALERSRLRCRSVELVSPLGERKGIRFAYRADTEEGRTVKLRHFGVAEHARAHVELRTGLEEAFAPVLGRCGAVVLEEWVDGVALDELDAEARAEEAGAVLGRLHARPLAAGIAATCDTLRWRSGAESDLEILRLLRDLEGGAIDWGRFFAARASENLLAVTVNVIAVVLDAFAMRDSLPRLRAELDARAQCIVYAGRAAALALVGAPPKSAASLRWFARIYPGSMLYYVAWFWAGGFPANLRQIGRPWLAQSLALRRGGSRGFRP